MNININIMSRFIKLTNLIINTTKIIKIEIVPVKYIVYMNYHYEGVTIFGSGSLQSYQDKIEICKSKHPYDYQIVSDWILKA